MIWILSLLTVSIGYFFGNLNTLTLASRLLFKTNLRRLGKDSVFISNFRRIYGWKGVVKLLLAEVIPDVLPMLIGGVLMGLVDYGDIGKAMAGLSLVLGRLYPALNNMKGSNAEGALVVTGLMIDPSVGIAVLVVFAAIAFFTKYIKLGTIVSAVVFFGVTVLTVDDSMIVKLAAITMALVLLWHVPSLLRLANGKEKKLSLKTDLTYKFDEKFQ